MLVIRRQYFFLIQKIFQKNHIDKLYLNKWEITFLENQKKDFFISAENFNYSYIIFEG